MREVSSPVEITGHQNVLRISFLIYVQNMRERETFFTKETWYKVVNNLNTIYTYKFNRSDVDVN